VKVPAEQQKKFTVRLPPELVRRVKVGAIDRRVTTEEYVRQALEAFLKQQNKDDKQ
jgi:predicted transcriptional regulator